MKKNRAQLGYGPFKKRTCDTQHVLCVRGKMCIDSYHNAPVHGRSRWVCNVHTVLFASCIRLPTRLPGAPHPTDVSIFLRCVSRGIVTYGAFPFKGSAHHSHASFQPSSNDKLPGTAE